MGRKKKKGGVLKKLKKGLKGALKFIPAGAVMGSFLGGASKKGRRNRGMAPMPAPEPSPMAEEPQQGNVQNVGYPPTFAMGQPGPAARYVQPIPQYYGGHPEAPAPPPTWQQAPPAPAPYTPAPAYNYPPPMSYPEPSYPLPPPPPALPPFGTAYDPYGSPYGEDPYAEPLSGAAAQEYAEIMAGVTDQDEDG